MIRPCHRENLCRPVELVALRKGRDGRLDRQPRGPPAGLAIKNLSECAHCEVRKSTHFLNFIFGAMVLLTPFTNTTKTHRRACERASPQLRVMKLHVSGEFHPVSTLSKHFVLCAILRVNSN